jgi:hypothetical protein
MPNDTHQHVGNLPRVSPPTPHREFRNPSAGEFWLSSGQEAAALL